jgi:hypothetical protein
LILTKPEEHELFDPALPNLFVTDILELEAAAPPSFEETS